MSMWPVLVNDDDREDESDPLSSYFDGSIQERELELELRGLQRD